MQLTTEDYQRTSALTPSQVEGYLVMRGWSRAHEFGGGRVWQLSAASVADPLVEVLVPQDPALRDYLPRLVEVLDALSSVEQRSVQGILREIALPSADWQYIRLDPGTEPGTIPIGNLVPAITGMRDLIVSAGVSASTDTPSAVQPAHKPQQVRELVSRVRADQSQVGSYILRMYVPVPASGTDPTDKSGTPLLPFERRVTNGLYSGVLSAYYAASASQAAGELVDFVAYTKHGLSANLCEALVRIGGETHEGFEIRFSWSPEQPIGRATPPIALNPPLLEYLEAGAKDLRARLTQLSAVVVGTVVRLDREPNEGSGEATILGLAEGSPDARPRKFRLHLGADHYQLAIRAHQNDQMVEVVGDLQQRGSVINLVHIEVFRALEDQTGTAG
ncbi:hypothetical protein ACWGLP_29360 [Streptomyces lydicus]